MPLLAAWHADLLPVVATEEAGLFWRTVAAVLCAHRYLPIPISPLLCVPCDLFGQITERGGFAPHAHALADAVLSPPTDTLALVTLENLAAAPWDGVLSPLLDAWQERRPLRLLHPHRTGTSGVYGALATVVWPDGLLLSASWTACAFPPPASFFTRAVLLVPESENTGAAAGETNASAFVTTAFVAPGGWRAAPPNSQATETERAGARDEIAAHKAAVPLMPALRFFRALRGLAPNEAARLFFGGEA